MSFLRAGWSLAVLLLHGSRSVGKVTSVIERLISDHYPSQYVVQRLRQGQQIWIDGQLEDEAWAEVPWLENFMDLAGPRHRSARTSWQSASRDYARRLTGSENPTRVKLRWDENFLYVGAELRSKHVAASVEGHCDKLHSNLWQATPVLPYFDDDFEVFIDASQSNYYYVEFEMNARNATYDTLWYVPQAGLGSVAPECILCCNTTWNAGKGLCDHGAEEEGGSWTMEMFSEGARPGDGMLSATTNNSWGWTLEIRFPILSSPGHGGLLNRKSSQHLPNVSVESLHPARGQRFWWATFANALHASWWSKLTVADTKHPESIKRLCEEVIRDDNQRYGFSQFLLDANNAAPTCYYEAASQNLGGHQYMHNPDQFGYLQFAEQQEAPAPRCGNVFWLARFVLAQVYQAEVNYLMTAGEGCFTSNLVELLAPAACNISNACNVSSLADALNYVDVTIFADDGKRTGACVQYNIPGVQNSSSTGGPCFTAFVTYTVRSKSDRSKRRKIKGSINEARLMSQPDVGQRWDAPDDDWLCLETADIVPASIYV